MVPLEWSKITQFVLSRFDAPHFATLHETSLLHFIFKYMKRLNFTVRTKSQAKKVRPDLLKSQA